MNARNLFSERLREVDDYLAYLQTCEHPSLKPRASIWRVLLAQAVLMLYNLVEATTTACIEDIMSEVRRKSLTFEDAATGMRELHVKHYARRLNAVGPKAAKKIVAELLEAMAANRPLPFEWPRLEGNVDLRRIRDLAKSADVPFTCSVPGHEIKYVKDKRNSLAHGDESFSDVGQDLTVSSLEDKRNECHSALMALVSGTETFLSDARYLRAV